MSMQKKKKLQILQLKESTSVYAVLIS